MATFRPLSDLRGDGPIRGPLERHLRALQKEVVELNQSSVELKLPLAGGTMSGEINFKDKLASSGNAQIRFTDNNYTIWQDNVGAGVANSRLWISGPAGGELILGPRSGGVILNQIRYRANDHRFEGYGQVLIPDGSDSLPGLAYWLDPDTGISRVTTNMLGVSTGGTRRIAISTTAYTNGLIRDSPTTYAQNVFIHAVSGDMARSTSSLRHKPGWVFVDEKVLADLAMPTPITWEDEEGGVMLGFGTEHVQAMLDAATQDRDERGRPEYYDIRSLVAILSSKVKRLEETCLAK